ncbi:transposase family protein [Streptomyces sp. NPDC050448]|uniref:transposase family protein n=1 Tax=Streptomyces sp. NPDC050448 TaxID=3155404 RepID=UPI0034338352
MIISDRRITGLSSDVIAELDVEVGPLWHERYQARLESRPRERAVGAGAKHRLVFVDRLLATLVHFRHGVTHDVLACWFGVDRATITRAIGEVRPLLAALGCTIAASVRLRTLAEVIDHLGASGQAGIIDGTEIRVRRPAVGRRDREKFISGKNKQNVVKAMVLTDADGRLLFRSPAQPGKLCRHHGPSAKPGGRRRYRLPQARPPSRHAPCPSLGPGSRVHHGRGP